MFPTEVKPKRTKSPEQALAALMRLCARSERSQSDARRLMRGWGVGEQEAAEVVARLVRERFIDDARYAGAFVREKLNLSGWGVYKIRAALARKAIAKPLIDEALTQANPEAMAERLQAQLLRKARSIKHNNPHELRAKLIRYGLSLGYDYQTVLDAAANQSNNTDECTDF